jgi:DNA-binding MarR family transcriptional regulator
MILKSTILVDSRDYTTVSRQITRLEALDLVKRRKSAADRCVNEAVIAPKGKAMAGRPRNGRAVFRTWKTRDIELVRLMR